MPTVGWVGGFMVREHITRISTLGNCLRNRKLTSLLFVKTLIIKSASNNSMTVVQEDGGRTNMYAKEPQMEIIEVKMNHNENAEKLNGRLAMLGVMAALGAYALTGQVIPGVW